MTQLSSQRNTPGAASGEVVVRLPRASDALGHALRRAYGGDCGLPDDWVRALALLDRHR